MFDVVIETERLRLRPYRQEDLEELHAMFSDAEHMRHYPHPFSLEESQAWLDRNLDRSERLGFGLWFAEDRKTEAFVGTIGLTLQPVEDDEHVEVGWHVRPGRKGEGLAPEGAAAARDWAFANLDVDHLIALVRVGNSASARVAEKIGMTVWRDVDHKGMAHRVYRIDRDGATIGA